MAYIEMSNCCILMSQAIWCRISYLIPVMAAIFDSPLTLMSDSVHINPIELLDPENVGATFEISLLSNIEADNFVSTSGNDGHL